MISPVATKWILIGLLSVPFVPIASSDGADRIDVALHAAPIEENKATTPLLFPYDKEKSDNGSFEKPFKNKPDILSRLFKINIDRLRNQTDQASSWSESPRSVSK